MKNLIVSIVVISIQLISTHSKAVQAYTKNSEYLGPCETIAYLEYNEWSVDSKFQTVSGSIFTGAGLIILGAFKNPISIIPASAFLVFGIYQLNDVHEQSERHTELEEVMMLYKLARTRDKDLMSELEVEMSDEVAEYINELNQGAACENGVALGYSDVVAKVEKHLKALP